MSWVDDCVQEFSVCVCVCVCVGELSGSVCGPF